MATKTITYNASRTEVEKIKAALVQAGKVSALPPPADVGNFTESGYAVRYAYTSPSGNAGTLLVEISGSWLFLGTAVSKLNSYIQPYLAIPNPVTSA